jgi:hypothetical protein
MNALEMMVLLVTTLVLVTGGTALLSQRSARRRRAGARVQMMKQFAAEDVAAVRGKPVVAAGPGPRGHLSAL